MDLSNPDDNRIIENESVDEKDNFAASRSDATSIGGGEEEEGEMRVLKKQKIEMLTSNDQNQSLSQTTGSTVPLHHQLHADVNMEQQASPAIAANNQPNSARLDQNLQVTQQQNLAFMQAMRSQLVNSAMGNMFLPHFDSRLIHNSSLVAPNTQRLLGASWAGETGTNMGNLSAPETRTVLEARLNSSLSSSPAVASLRNQNMQQEQQRSQGPFLHPSLLHNNSLLGATAISGANNAGQLLSLPFTQQQSVRAGPNTNPTDINPISSLMGQYPPHLMSNFIHPTALLAANAGVDIGVAMGLASPAPFAVANRRAMEIQMQLLNNNNNNNKSNNNNKNNTITTSMTPSGISHQALYAPRHDDRNNNNNGHDNGNGNGNGEGSDKDDNKNKYPTLFLPCDDESLSEYQCLVRKQIEIFDATEEDVESNAQGRNRRIILGQVGIRCRHCSMIPPRHRTRGATYYPAKLQGLYQAAQNMASAHLCRYCQLIPDELRQRLLDLRDRKSSAGGGKNYWADGARILGVAEKGEVLRFIPSTSTSNPDGDKGTASDNHNVDDGGDDDGDGDGDAPSQKEEGNKGEEEEKREGESEKIKKEEEKEVGSKGEG